MEEWIDIGKDEISTKYSYYVECSINQHNQLLVKLFGEGAENLHIVEIDFGELLFYSALEEGWNGTDLYFEKGLAINRPNLSDGVLFEVFNGEVGNGVHSSKPNLPIYHYYIVGYNYHIEIVSMSRPVIKV
ncbi:hypothetical protein ACS60R_11255 [Streptococcus suis]|uniref:hypothetical protein n=1 Tax=Streptococcus suis TaxID=1307 RepID=UPI0037085AF6